MFSFCGALAPHVAHTAQLCPAEKCTEGVYFTPCFIVTEQLHRSGGTAGTDHPARLHDGSLILQMQLLLDPDLSPPLPPVHPFIYQAAM